ncbi:MAG: PQQ-binding-like beta-propeller repeat protein [Euryarchaeota archaeon]|nr:PQQ-binding-like beta-propeller repeat protein [Euryarchaeota archaeon]MCG2736048.1 PQQ-binding-like beta-propeller repeat protein [Candidatus Methanoperedenaceae archaeon]
MSENISEIPEYETYWKRKLKSLTDISQSRDGKYLLVGSNEGRIYLFDKDGIELWQQTLGNIKCLDLSSDSSRIVVGDNSGSLYFLSRDGRRESEKKLSGCINSLSISDDGKNICAGTDKGIIYNIDSNGNELWKHKIKGACDGGICHSPDGKFIIAGSWDTVHCYGTGGELIWKSKFTKRITAVSMANDGSFIAVCTKGSIGILDLEGKIISETSIANGFRDASIWDGRIYAISLNRVFILNNKGEQLGNFDVPEPLLKICVNSVESISAISENRIYMFSSLMKPRINILTDSLTIGKTQTLMVEIINNSPKEFEYELELECREFSPDKMISAVKVPAKGRSNVEFEVKPETLGKCNVALSIKNKNVKASKILEIVPPKVELKISQHPKYEFNAEDDDISMIIDFENTGKVAAKNISVLGDSSLSLPLLKPGTKDTLIYKLKLPSGVNDLSIKIVYEDDFGNKFSHDCICKIPVQKSPYVWGFKQPLPKIISGKTTIVKINIKNIRKNVLQLNFNVASEKIEITPKMVSLQLNPSENKDIELAFTPKEYCDNTPINISIEYEGKKQDYPENIKIYPKPPFITGKSLLQKSRYRLGEPVNESLELINEGETPATNIIIDGILITPFLEPKKPTSFHRDLKSDEVKYYRPEKNKITFKDEFDEEFSNEFNSSPYTVLPPEIKIKVPEMNLQENIKKEVKFEIENVSNEVKKDIIVVFSIDGDSVKLDKPEVRFDMISPVTAKPVVFECTACKEGVVDFNIYVKHQETLIEQHSGKIYIGSKNPKLEFEVDDSEMIQNNYSLLKLIINNRGEMEAREISIKLQTEIETSKNSKLEANHVDFPWILGEIKPGERKEITFEFRPITAGRTSLTILNTCKSAQGKCLQEKKDQLFVTIKPEISKPSVVVEGDFVSGTSIRDSVLQKSNVGQGEPGQIGDIVKSGQIVSDRPASISIQDSLVQKSNISGRETAKVRKYRDLCVQAIKDGNITPEEREILDNQAKELFLSESEKKNVENEIFGNTDNIIADFESYKKQAATIFSKGKEITESERGMLDVMRISCNLTKQQQKQIEDGLEVKYQKPSIDETIQKICPVCGKTIHGIFCTGCGAKTG